jgi:hypothetical protein
MKGSVSSSNGRSGGEDHGKVIMASDEGHGEVQLMVLSIVVEFFKKLLAKSP